MARFAEEYNLQCVSQELVTWESRFVLVDCLSTLVLRGSKWSRSNCILQNAGFMLEAKHLSGATPCMALDHASDATKSESRRRPLGHELRLPRERQRTRGQLVANNICRLTAVNQRRNRAAKIRLHLISTVLLPKQRCTWCFLAAATHVREGTRQPRSHRLSTEFRTELLPDTLMPVDADSPVITL
jgi:hypothetical protein